MSDCYILYLSCIIYTNEMQKICRHSLNASADTVSEQVKLPHGVPRWAQTAIHQFSGFLPSFYRPDYVSSLSTLWQWGGDS